MTEKEIHNVLVKALSPRSPSYDRPDEGDWRMLEQKFSTKFSSEFKMFMDQLAAFSFPGEILNVHTHGKTNGNDGLSFTYDFEMKGGDWNPDMIPFYAIGNGDYFCLSAKEGSRSKIFYRYHEDSRYEIYTDSFSEWIRSLPEFLA